MPHQVRVQFLLDVLFNFVDLFQHFDPEASVAGLPRFVNPHLVALCGLLAEGLVLRVGPEVLSKGNQKGLRQVVADSPPLRLVELFHAQVEI